MAGHECNENCPSNRHDHYNRQTQQSPRQRLAMLRRVAFDVVISDQQAPAVDDVAVEVAELAFTDSGIRKEEHDA